MPETIDATLRIAPSIDSRLVHLDQYFGIWAIEEMAFGAMWRYVASLDLATHVARNSAMEGNPRQHAQARTDEQSADGQRIAMIAIRGMLTKQGSSVSDAGSTIAIRKAIRDAAGDGNVDAILLVFDSPGGVVSGVADLAADVRSARSQKPVFAFVEDLCASAAYWIASQCDRVFANQYTAQIGSIGTYLALYDYSKQAEKEGVRAVVIKSGHYKGAGFPGTEVTEEQQAAWQQVVDGLQAQFSEAVSSGRSIALATVRVLADGRVHLAADAQSLGLIDGVQSLETTIAQLAAESRNRTLSHSNMRSETTMSEDPKIVTASDIKACCPGCSDAFIVAQLTAGATLDQAQSAHMEAQLARIDELTKQTATLETQNTQLQEANKASQSGVVPLGSSGKSQEMPEDPIAAFHAAVEEKMKAGLVKGDAVRAVIAGDPALHAAYVTAHNEAVGPSSYRGART